MFLMPAAFAAARASTPAFDEWAWTTSGRCSAKRRCSLRRAEASAAGAISRVISGT